MRSSKKGQRNMYLDISREELEREFEKIYQEGLAKRRAHLWTKELDTELKRLKDSGMKTIDIAKELGRTYHSVDDRMTVLGIRRHR